MGLESNTNIFLTRKGKREVCTVRHASFVVNEKIDTVLKALRAHGSFTKRNIVIEYSPPSKFIRT